LSEPQPRQVAEALRSLFAGSHPAAHLATWRGERRTFRGELELWRLVKHVLGEDDGRSGYIPFAGAGSPHVAWACIDVDTKDPRWPFDTEATRALILRADALAREAGIAVAWERSKSLGWHGWVFLSGYCQAIQVRAVLLTTLEQAGYPIRPLPPDLVCPRTNAAPDCGNGTWAPLYDAFAPGPACKFVDPATDRALPLMETLTRLDRERTPAEVFAKVTGLALDRFRQPERFVEDGDVHEVLERFDAAGLDLEVNAIRAGKARVRCPYHPSRSGDSAFVTASGWLHCTSETCEAHESIHFSMLENPQSPL
jgi:hypothetical protein